jgi:cell division protein FtsB
MDNHRKEEKRKFSVLLVVSIAVVVSFLVSFFLGQSGMLKLRQLEQEYDRVATENYQLAMENKRNADDIRKLRYDPATIEKIAREELLFVSPHDTVLVVPEKKQPDSE